MRRVSADGYHVVLWSDGAVTGALGYRLRGVPVRRSRTGPARYQALKVGRLMLDEVCLWETPDFGRLYKAAEAAVKRDGLPGTLRRFMREGGLLPLKPVWIVLHADREGKPTEKFWSLPRLRWPGLAVWWTKNRGYAVMRRLSGARHADETYDELMTYKTLREVQAYLKAVPMPAYKETR